MDVIRRWCDEGWTKGHVEVADELIHPNFKVHGAGGQVVEPGIEGLKGLIQAWRTGFPGRRPARRRHLRRGRQGRACGSPGIGTHLGEFMGVPATGKTVSVGTIGIDRVVDGKVVEGWGELDMLGLHDDDRRRGAGDSRQD